MKQLKFFYLFFSIFLFLNLNTEAECAKCAAIERARAEEQAKTGPKSTPYYDEAFRGKISQTYNEISQVDSIQVSSTRNKVGNQKMESSSNQTIQEKTGSQQNIRSTSKTEYDTGTTSNTGYQPKTSANGGSSTTTNRIDDHGVIYAVINNRDFLKVLNGPFTVFIPSNEALNELPKGTLENLLRTENRERLIELIGNHIVSARIDNVKRNARVKNLNGVDLIIRSENGETTINGARVLNSEMVGENGVIYIIDNVLIP